MSEDEHFPLVIFDWSWMWHEIRRGYWCLSRGMVKQWYYAHRSAWHHFKRIFKAIKNGDWTERRSNTIKKIRFDMLKERVEYLENKIYEIQGSSKRVAYD